jgi:hypothetical protein
MADKVLTDISAGSHSMYQIVDPGDGVSIILRETEDPKGQVQLMKSVIPVLIRVLQEVK